MDIYKDLVADLQEYKQYLPLLKQYFTLNVEQMRIRDELIKLFSYKTDKGLARHMYYTRYAFGQSSYTYQFNKRALKKYFDTVIAEVQKQQKWTNKEWRTVALKMLARQEKTLQQERENVSFAVLVAGYAAEYGLDKVRPYATDTISRLNDFSEAARKLNGEMESHPITFADIVKLRRILISRRIKDHTA